ncbi:hypothetical protein, partial [Symbiopectobacterium sp.]|uniref:hypothetical protein n=1 Tax=Symbiopectobacterium sp. TaxID=2952789 RepID=UPI003F3FF2AF
VSVLCSTSLSPVDDLGSLSIDQIAQLGLSSLQVIYYSEQLFRRRSQNERCGVDYFKINGTEFH